MWIIIRNPLKFLINPFSNTFYGRALIFIFINALFLKAKNFIVPMLKISFVYNPVSLNNYFNVEINKHKSKADRFICNFR